MTHFKYTFIFPEVKYPFKQTMEDFVTLSNSVNTYILISDS